MGILFMLEHEQWITKAQEDLNDASTLCRSKSFSSTMYFCQQAAEKALKSYLFFKKQELQKIHDLVKLCALCKNFDHDFQKLAGACELLNPFATKFRYPSEFDQPDLDDAKLAIKQAESIIKFVIKKISGPMVNQMEIR